MDKGLSHQLSPFGTFNANDFGYSVTRSRLPFRVSSVISRP